MFLRAITGHWGSVHRGRNKSNKNKRLAAHCQEFEIDQEVNSIQVNRQASQVRSFTRSVCDLHDIGGHQPDPGVRHCSRRPSPSRTKKFAGAADGH